MQPGTHHMPHSISFWVQIWAAWAWDCSSKCWPASLLDHWHLCHLWPWVEARRGCLSCYCLGLRLVWPGMCPSVMSGSSWRQVPGKRACFIRSQVKHCQRCQALRLPLIPQFLSQGQSIGATLDKFFETTATIPEQIYCTGLQHWHRAVFRCISLHKRHCYSDQHSVPAYFVKLYLEQPLEMNLLLREQRLKMLDVGCKMQMDASCCECNINWPSRSILCTSRFVRLQKCLT